MRKFSTEPDSHIRLFGDLSRPHSSRARFYILSNRSYIISEVEYRISNIGLAER